MSEYLRSLRHQKNMTLLEIAGKVHKNKAYICELEIGRKAGSVKTLQSLANLYGCDFKELCYYQTKELKQQKKQNP